MNNMRVNVLLKVVLFVVVVFSVFGYARSQGTCNTPDNKVGQCTPVKECKTIVDFIQSSPKPVPQSVARKLNEYVCAYGESGTTVCCPSEPILVGRTAEPTTPPPPPDITGHKNLRLLPQECGLIGLGDKIRNGVNAMLNEFPWMSLLAYTTRKGPQFKCGGTVINDRYILTAAHCLVGTPYPLVSVRVGEYDVDSEKDCYKAKCLPPIQDLTVEKVLYHPDYNTTLYANDIGLIRVSKINLNDGAKTVCLPINEELREQEYSNAVVTGWGYTDPSGKTSTGVLQRVELPLRNLSACIEAYKIVPQVTLSHKQLCAGGRDAKDSCGGDSGGPLQVASYYNDEDRYVQHGVISIGHAYCGTEGFPGVYTKVAYYLKWILDSIEP